MFDTTTATTVTLQIRKNWLGKIQRRQVKNQLCFNSGREIKKLLQMLPSDKVVENLVAKSSRQSRTDSSHGLVKHK